MAIKKLSDRARQALIDDGNAIVKFYKVIHGNMSVKTQPGDIGYPHKTIQYTKGQEVPEYLAPARLKEIAENKELFLEKTSQGRVQRYRVEITERWIEDGARASDGSIKPYDKYPAGPVFVEVVDSSGRVTKENIADVELSGRRGGAFIPDTQTVIKDVVLEKAQAMADSRDEDTSAPGKKLKSKRRK